MMGMHVVGQDDLISIAPFDLDQHQNISSPQTECNSLLSLCPYIKQQLLLHLIESQSIHAIHFYTLKLQQLTARKWV
jgi:hypothetical protein